jgi:hypothetical protein
VSADPTWPPTADALLPLLGLSESAAVVADVGASLRPGRAPGEAQALVDRTRWMIADDARGIVLRATDRVLQVAAAAADERGPAFKPFARVHWADLPRDVTAVAAVVAPLCRSAQQLHALRPRPTP